jgi:hypothetical protein
VRRRKSALVSSDVRIQSAPFSTGKFLDAFGDNDQPWDRWSPPVFDDDGFLAYQCELGVKP